MRTLIFDTETTGIVNHKSPDHSIQPHPVQLACILLENNTIINSAAVLIDPGVPIEKGAFEKHKITEEKVKTFGFSLKAATGLFLNFLNRCDRIVGHGVDFDIIITEAMIYRTLADFDLQNYRDKPRVCTMISSTEVCKLPGKFGKYKWPKLEEAYKILVDPKGFEKAHDAMADTIACLKVLRALEDRGIALQRGKR